jgi:hypothetical protein
MMRYIGFSWFVLINLHSIYQKSSLQACEAGVAIHLALTAARPELDCFVAALLAMTGFGVRGLKFAPAS